jgi:hypothetical protein
LAVDLLEVRIGRLERLSESLAKELRSAPGGEEALSSVERESYRRLVNGALLKLHKGWGVLTRAVGRQARRVRRRA